MLSTRLLTAAVALPAVLAAVIFAPHWLFTLIIAALLGWGLYEVAEMRQPRPPALTMLAVAGAGSAVFLFLCPGVWIVPLVVILAMVALVVIVARSGHPTAGDNAAMTLLGALWVGALFPYFALLRNRQGGVAIIVLMLLLVIASDSGAYFAGRALGRVKLAPQVSPNKTVEGAIGGLILAIIVGLILRPALAPAWGIWRIVAASVAVSVLAQVGDLAGSAYKRTAGVKDSGWLFPGHGGLLDRTCSLVFAAVFTYYYTR